jgi:hypothetical protein
LHSSIIAITGCGELASDWAAAILLVVLKALVMTVTGES